MIDVIQNGVTTGGVAPTVYQPNDNGNLYRQYLEQAQQARQQALNKNYDLVKDVDLSKVDPRDRDAIQQQYDDWRQKALVAPVSNKRGDYNKWRSDVLQGQSDLKNKIGEIIGRRKELVDGVERRKDLLDHDGIISANNLIDSPIVDKDGKFVTYDLNALGLKPEHVYDADANIQKLINQNIVKSQQLSQQHRGRDGKTVSVDADVLNTNGLNQTLQNELQYNPEFKDAIDKGYKKFQSLNPNSPVSYDQYFNDRVKHHYPATSARDAQLLKDVPAGDGLYAYNYNVKDPNNYVQHININSANKDAERKQDIIDLHNNMLGSVAKFFASGNPDDAQTASQVTSQILKGQRFGDMGYIKGIHFETDRNGRKYMKLFTNNDNGYIKSTDQNIYSDDTDWDKKLHDVFNSRFIKSPQNMVGEDKFNSWRDIRKAIEKTAIPKTNLLKLFGGKIKGKAKGLQNLFK